MTTRSRRETITFKHPFRIKGIDRLLPPGAYEVITDEEMIEGLSFASFRRVATMIMVPAAPPRTSTMERISISPVDLADAQLIDASAPRE
jgi:hypothetical protein